MFEISNTLGVVALVLAALAIVMDVSKDIRKLVSARNVFLLSIMAWYLVEACIVPEEVRNYDQEEYNLGLLTIGLSLSGFLVIYHGIVAKAFDPIFRRLAKVDQPDVLWRVFVFALFIGFLPLLVVSQGNVIMIIEDAFVASARWSGVFQRGRYGGVRDAFLELQMFLRAALPLAAAILVQKRQGQTQRFIAVLFLIFMFARAFNSGTRSQVIEVFLPIAAAIYWRMSVPMKRNAIRFGVPATAILILVWSAATVVTRNQGAFDWEKANDAKYVGFEMFRELMFLQRTVPEDADHKWGHTYLVQAVNPIPRFLWPGKPTGDAGLELASMQGQVTDDGYAFLTISPGLIGEMHWNFGIAGVIALSGFLGYLARSWDRVLPLAERSIVAFTVFAAGLSIIFLSGRSVNMSTLYGMLALVALLVFFTRK